LELEEDFLLCGEEDQRVDEVIVCFDVYVSYRFAMLSEFVFSILPVLVSCSGRSEQFPGDMVL
jgi:hypothetical protein